MLSGLSSLWPAFSALKILTTGIPEKGTLPQVNNSQTVTPNAHCKEIFINACLHLSIDLYQATNFMTAIYECEPYTTR